MPPSPLRPDLGGRGKEGGEATPLHPLPAVAAALPLQSDLGGEEGRARPHRRHLLLLLRERERRRIDRGRRRGEEEKQRDLGYAGLTLCFLVFNPVNQFCM